jgi:hypothetical protein
MPSSTYFPGSSASDWSNAFNTKINLGGDFKGIDKSYDPNKYWNPSALDTANLPWSNATRQDDGQTDNKGVNWKDVFQTGAKQFLKDYQTKLQESSLQSENKSKQIAAGAGGMVSSGQGWSSQQMLPNLSSLQYSGPTIQMAGVQGGPGFIDTPLGKALLGVGSSALGAFAAPVFGAAGGALASSLFPK